MVAISQTKVMENDEVVSIDSERGGVWREGAGRCGLVVAAFEGSLSSRELPLLNGLERKSDSRWIREERSKHYEVRLRQWLVGWCYRGGLRCYCSCSFMGRHGVMMYCHCVGVGWC